MESLSSSNVVLSILMAMLAGQLYARPQPDEKEEMKKALFNVCSGKHPISEEMRANALKGILSEDRNFKCFLKCTLEEISLIDEQGIIDGETLLSFDDSMRSIYEPIIKSCLPNEAGRPDGCETSFNFIACGIKIEPKSAELLPM